MLKDIARRLLSADARSSIRKYQRRLKCSLQFWKKPVSLAQMRCILTEELGLHLGDRVLVTSAFGGLNAEFTPRELCALLIDIVGSDGLVVMPYYPPGSSEDWARSKAQFDMASTPSSVGVVTSIFAHLPLVCRSLHPTKSISAWGKGAEELVNGHAYSRTPFSEDSPYGKFLVLGGTKSIGLGTRKFPLGHCLEDIVGGSVHQYQLQKAVLQVKNGDVVTTCETYIHNGARHQIPPSEYIAKMPAYKRVKVGYSDAFVVDNDAAMVYYKEQFAKGKPSIW